ncbi:WavE lipopolysaccharide synthesis family protein [Brachyspira intermedia]|uniref:WavE lipopolysaccharide synthesis family protein n=1 Tax=Brachyspira intermedia TaxID=84377 RepID=UPI003006828F
MNINMEDITVIVQGTTLENNDVTPSKDYIIKCIDSIKTHLPKSKIILSTWENEKINKDLEVDDIIFNKDPGFKPRGEEANSKQNNVNRQIVSTINGLKKVDTKYALKFRTDFYFTSSNFINYFNKFQQYDNKYKIVKNRILCCMFGTRKPIAKHYSLPFHVADFSTFGLTEDLINLYDIPLVTDEEFDYFKIHRIYTEKYVFCK